MAKSQSPVQMRMLKPEPPEAEPEASLAWGVRSSLASFNAIVDRVEHVIESETTALTQNRRIDLSVLHRQKRQGLLELSRIMRTIAGTGADAEAGRRLAQLADKLETNRVVLDRQLRAVREVADIISLSLQASESDGTYSRMVGQR